MPSCVGALLFKLPSRLAVAICGSEASSANAAPPIAAVFVVAPLNSDAFVSAYTFELAADALRSAQFRVTPPPVASRALARRGGAAGRVVADECVLDAALELGAVFLLIVEATAPQTDLIEVSLRALEVGALVTEVAQAQATEDLHGIATAISTFLAPVAERPTACLVHLDGGEDATVEVDAVAVEV